MHHEDLNLLHQAVKTLVDYSDIITKIKNMKEATFYNQFRPILSFFEHNSASIEVDYKERIYYIPFISVPYFKDLPKQLKEEFNETVDRTSRESKVRSLIFDYIRFVSSAKYTSKVKTFMKKIPIINILFDYYYTLGLLIFIISITINILIITDYSISNEEVIESIREVITDLAYVIIVLISMLIVMITFQNIPEAVDYGLRKLPLWKKMVSILKVMLIESGILYYILYLMFTILGITVHPFFHSFTLTDSIHRFPTMKIIFRAVYIPRKSLLLTLCMIIILCYVFALVWYSNMSIILKESQKIYGTEEILPPDQDYCCSYMLLCFLCFINNLIKEDAKMATVLAGGNLQKPNDMNYTVFAFDNIALIILKFLLLEILAGLIIDTFGALRDEDISKNEDVKGSCFICGLAVEEFERSNCEGFDVHTSKEHYMWDYICYLAYLEEKNQEDYDGVEEHINKQLIGKSIEWVPNKKTIAFDKEADEGRVYSNVEKIEGSILEMRNSMQRMTQLVKSIDQESENYIRQMKAKMSPGKREKGGKKKTNLK